MLSNGSSVWSFGTLKSYHLLILGSCSFIGFQFWRSARTFPKRAFRYYYIIFLFVSSFFAPISRHFPESSCIISLHSILYTTVLNTEASFILETARSKRNSGESCSNIWLTFRIIRNVTLNAKLVGNVTCAVGSNSAPGAQTAACVVDATWRESSLGAYYRDVRR